MPYHNGNPKPTTTRDDLPDRAGWKGRTTRRKCQPFDPRIWINPSKQTPIRIHDVFLDLFMECESNIDDVLPETNGRRAWIHQMVVAGGWYLRYNMVDERHIQFYGLYAFTQTILFGSERYIYSTSSSPLVNTVC